MMEKSIKNLYNLYSISYFYKIKLHFMIQIDLLEHYFEIDSQETRENNGPDIEVQHE